MNALEKFEKLSQKFIHTDIPDNFTDIVKDEFGIDISAKYGNQKLKNPVLVAPGQMTRFPTQIQLIKEANFSGCVLKSVVAEDEKGNCSMVKLRKKPTKVETVYDSDDTEGEFPIIHWDGGLDTRCLDEYMEFARSVVNLSGSDFLIIVSLLGHLPSYHEDLIEKEWLHTTRMLYETGYRFFEIDFCPFLKQQDHLMEKKTILRWYSTIPLVLKRTFPDIFVFPKILNLEYGLSFQMEMVKCAIRAGADGVVIANRIYKPEFGCAHGGKELKERNLAQIKQARNELPEVSISGTGGIYTGAHIVEYLQAGAENVQILSFLMGRLKSKMIKKGNRFKQVFYKLMLDAKDGYIKCLLEQREKLQ